MLDVIFALCRPYEHVQISSRPQASIGGYRSTLPNRDLQILVITNEEWAALCDEVALHTFHVCSAGVKICRDAGWGITEEDLETSDVVLAYAFSWWSASSPPATKFDGKLFFKLNPACLS